jgi:LTXXQ motif family protein
LSRHPGLAASGAAGAIGANAVGANASLRASPTAPALAPQVDANGRRLRGVPPGFRTANDPNPARALRNQTFSNPARLAGRTALANTTFRGRFAANRFANGGNQQRFNRNRVLGWYGRTFWPYAYYDMFDYSFWPYAYDTFWPYAYDDLYGGMFGPYAYGYDQSGPPPGADYPPGSPPPTVSDTTGTATDREAQVCSERAATLTNWPIDKIAQAIQPNAQQRSALDRLTTATGRAVDVLQAACPTQLPSTPTGRLAALQNRLEAMLRAVDTVAPALNALYQSLNDEQRARFDSVGQEQTDAAASSDQSDIAQACGDRAPGLALPIDRIAQEVRPDDRQNAALDNLSNASARAAETLKINCQTATALTPTGRIEAMRQRIGTMLNAVIMVRPALEAFYGSLSYEQRARFNVIGADAG